MQIIEPSVKIITPLHGLELLAFIEDCGRTCYQSYDSSNELGNMTRMLIKNGHESVLEHFSITIKAVMDIGAYKDLTRHRHASFSIESTRFCNYSRGKFGKELKFIDPCNIKKYDDTIRDVSFTEPFYTNEYKLWYNTMSFIEKQYLKMSSLGMKPDQLRLILPHSTAAEVCMTANLREWRHILKLRTAKAAHPSVRQIMLIILNKFKEEIPIIFDDINIDG